MIYFAVLVLIMLADKREKSKTVELTIATSKDELKNRLAAAEFDAKIVAGHRQDGSHPNLMEI